MKFFTKLGISVAVAFVGAYPFASATGLLKGVGVEHAPDGGIVFAAGDVLFFLTFGLISPTLSLIERILSALGRVEERPKPAIAITMMCVGGVLAIAAVLIQVTAAQEAAVAMNFAGPHGGPRLNVNSSGSFGLGILTIATFLLGASLIGLGIWASLKPAEPIMSRAIKSPVPELDEVPA